MKRLKISLLLMVIMILSVSAVSAAEFDESSFDGLDDYDSISADSIDDVNLASEDADILSEGDSDYNFTKLQNEITSSDTVTLNHDYVRVDGDKEITISKEVTIDGQNKYKIDAANLGGIFNVTSEGKLTLKGVTLLNGVSDSGAAVYSEGDLVIENSKFNDNVANCYGGAIYAIASVNISNSQFDNNKVLSEGTLNPEKPFEGGAIYVTKNGASSEINVNVKDSNFTNNIVEKGWAGAIRVFGNNLNIENTNFIQNIASATYDGGACAGALMFSGNDLSIKKSKFLKNKMNLGPGGAIYYYSLNGKLTIEDSIISGNNATSGGAIYSQGNGEIKNCTFEDNNADKIGGAIYQYFWKDSYLLKISESRFISNVAGTNGGAIWNNRDIEITGSNFTSNDASASGGAIYSQGKTSIENSNFIKNNAKTAGAVYVYNAISEIKSSEFCENFVTGNGGAIFFFSNSNHTLDVNNVLFKQNVAENTGGAILTTSKTVISNTEFEQNKANITGGAIHAREKSNLTIDNSNFTKNSAEDSSSFNIYHQIQDIKITNSKFDVIATINAEDIIYNNDAKINGTLNIGVSSLASKLKILLNENIESEATFDCENYSAVFEGLDVNKYVISFKDENENSYILAGEVDNEFKVKKDNKLNVTIEDVEYPNTPKAIVLADVDGEYKIKIGDSNYTVEVKEGKGEVPIQTLPAGDYTATLTLSDEDCTNLENTTTFKVNKGTPEIKIIVINATDKTNATVKVTSSADGNLTVKVNGTEYKINNAEANKEYSVVINVLPAKEYEVEVNYAESDNYLTNSAKSVLNVLIDSQPPQISFDDINPGNTGSVTVPLPENASGEISVIVDGKVVGTVKANGTTTVDIPAVGAGNHNIEINYTGDDKYGGFKISQSVNVASLAKLTGNNVNAFYDDGSVYKVQLLGDDGKPASGADVVIKVNGKKVATLKTDKNGYVSYKITQTPKASYTITAEANGLKATNKLVVKQIINAKKTTKVKKYRTSKIKITLKAKKVLKNKKLTIKFKGKKYTVKTNKKGVAYFKVKKNMVNKLKKGKKYSYTISYKKDTLKRYVQIK